MIPGYEGTWLALEERNGGVICSDIPDNPDLESRLEELPFRVTRTDNRYFTSKKEIGTEFFRWDLITVVDEKYQTMNNPMMVLVFVGILVLVGCLLIVVAAAVSRYLTIRFWTVRMRCWKYVIIT